MAHDQDPASVRPCGVAVMEDREEEAVTDAATEALFERHREVLLTITQEQARLLDAYTRVCNEKAGTEDILSRLIVWLDDALSRNEIFHDIDRAKARAFIAEAVAHL